MSLRNLYTCTVWLHNSLYTCAKDPLKEGSSHSLLSSPLPFSEAAHQWTPLYNPINKLPCRFVVHCGSFLPLLNYNTVINGASLPTLPTSWIFSWQFNPLNLPVSRWTYLSVCIEWWEPELLQCTDFSCLLKWCIRNMATLSWRKGTHDESNNALITRCCQMQSLVSLNQSAERSQSSHVLVVSFFQGTIKGTQLLETLNNGNEAIFPGKIHRVICCRRHVSNEFFFSDCSKSLFKNHSYQCHLS